MLAAFAGEFGPLWLEASPVIVDAHGTLLASIQTVTDAPVEWAAPAGRETLTLRVDPDNIGALRLYGSVGFIRTTGLNEG